MPEEDTWADDLVLTAREELALDRAGKSYFDRKQNFFAIAWNIEHWRLFRQHINLSSNQLL